MSDGQRAGAFLATWHLLMGHKYVVPAPGGWGTDFNFQSKTGKIYAYTLMEILEWRNSYVSS